MRAATTSRHGLPGFWWVLAPVGLFLVVGAWLIVRRTPPSAIWLAPICFGAFGSLILLWRSGAPVFAQSGVSMLIVVELLVLGVRSDGLGMRNVETKVSTAIASTDADSDGDRPPAAGAPSRVSISATSAEANHEAEELSRRIQQELPDRLRATEIQGDLKLDRLPSDLRLALSWSVGPAGRANWCGSTSVFAKDADAGIALLAKQVAKTLSARPGTGAPCAS